MKEVMIFRRPQESPTITIENPKTVRIAYGDKWIDFRDGKIIITDDSSGERFIPMPQKLTAENGAKALLMGEFSETEQIECSEYCCGEDETCKACNGTGYEMISVSVSWSTIKDIYKKAVEYFTGSHFKSSIGENAQSVEKQEN